MWEPTLWKSRKAVPSCQNGLVRRSHRGQRAAHVCSGLPRNLGGPVVSTFIYRVGDRRPTPAAGGAPARFGVKNLGRNVVPKREGNEAPRDGWQGVGMPHSTVEGGEPTQRDPVEGRGHRVREPRGGTTSGTLNPESVSTKLSRIAILARASARGEPLSRGAGCVNRARPDLRGAGEETPRSTRLSSPVDGAPYHDAHSGPPHSS